MEKCPLLAFLFVHPVCSRDFFAGDTAFFHGVRRDGGGLCDFDGFFLVWFDFLVFGLFLVFYIDGPGEIIQGSIFGGRELDFRTFFDGFGLGDGFCAGGFGLGGK